MNTLFGTDVTYKLDFQPHEAAIFWRDIEGTGGWQSFLTELRIDAGRKWLELTADQLERCYRYSKGSGGYQERFKAIVRAAWRAGWEQVED